jgi:hypothetical protein
MDSQHFQHSQQTAGRIAKATEEIEQRKGAFACAAKSMRGATAKLVPFEGTIGTRLHRREKAGRKMERAKGFEPSTLTLAT